MFWSLTILIWRWNHSSKFHQFTFLCFLLVHPWNPNERCIFSFFGNLGQAFPHKTIFGWSSWLKYPIHYCIYILCNSSTSIDCNFATSLQTDPWVGSMEPLIISGFSQLLNHYQPLSRRFRDKCETNQHPIKFNFHVKLAHLSSQSDSLFTSF